MVCLFYENQSLYGYDYLCLLIISHSILIWINLSWFVYNMRPNPYEDKSLLVCLLIKLDPQDKPYLVCLLYQTQYLFGHACLGLFIMFDSILLWINLSWFDYFTKLNPYLE